MPPPCAPHAGRPSYLVHLLAQINGGWNVSCTHRVGPDYTCLGRPPHGGALVQANELREVPPSPKHLAVLRKKMAKCERNRRRESGTE